MSAPRPPSRPSPPLDVTQDPPGVPSRTLRVLLANAAGIPLGRLEKLPLDVTYGLQRAWNRGYAVGESMGRHEGDRRRGRAGLAVLVATIAVILTAFQVGRVAAAPSSGPLPSPVPTAAVQSGAPPAQPGAQRPAEAAGDVLVVSAKPSAKLGDHSSGTNPDLTPDGSGDGISGQATWWYSFGPGLYAAIRPDLGHKGQLAVVCGGSPFHCLTLPIITTCACLGPGSGRLIDISRDAFVTLAPPGVYASGPHKGKPRAPGWQGTLRVTLQVVGP